MDVVVWLRSLGLGKYEALFREIEIDETVLPDLTAEDLKELGITALGHRRKLLAAIAALRSDASGKTPSADAATASTPPEDRAERRQVTVMFSDLVGSTPQQRRQKTLEALHAQVETLARKNPVLMIFEDTHWADPTSLEAFGRAVDRIANLPVLL